MITKVRAILKKLAKTEIQLEDLIDEREQMFESRSAEWHKTDRSEEFVEQIEALCDTMYSISDCVHSLEIGFGIDAYKVLEGQK